MPTNPTTAVQAFGQSLWYDNIGRSLIDSGQLQELIDDYGILGVTSNPSIFQKAIGESDDYDSTIMQMLDLDAHTIYERLAVDDIQRALDLFRPIYERTAKRDGYVSLEVSPLLASSTQKTIDEAKRLFEQVNRPNLMVKIPATPAGIPAVEACIAAGININVTLIFSVKNYGEVVEAYLRGLERRLAAGQPLEHIASVASFFLSRIDTMIDRMLENNIRAAQGRDLSRVSANSRLLGKAAIANARLAYRRFLQSFESERFNKLRQAGAQVQRPLWASTGTKNPAYPDTMYVDSLIGQDTVNTMPPATLKAFKDHGTAAETLTSNIQDADHLLDMLAEVGIDLEQVTQRLQDDGVELFIEAFENLISQVDAKRTILKTGVLAGQKFALGIYADAVQQAIKTLDAAYTNARIWARDATVWKDNTSQIVHISRHLGWLDTRQTIKLERLKTFQKQIREANFKHAVFLGMGGSVLTAESLRQLFGTQDGYPKLFTIDTTDPVYIRWLSDQINPAETLFVLASKSGKTIETRALFAYFYQLSGQRNDHFIAITDPDTPLAALAEQKGFREVFLNPPDVNGAYGALTYFGFVPAALMGLDLDALWTNAERMIDSCAENIPGSHHPGIWLGAVMGALAHQGRDKVSIHGTQSVAFFGHWAELVVAESAGKEGKGIVPIAGATVGKPHDYVSDRLFVYLKVEGDPDVDQLDAAVRAVREAGHPRVTMILKDKYALAGEFFRWQFASVIAAAMLHVNPFDASYVAKSKQNTEEMLTIYREKGALPAQTAMLKESGVSLYADERTISPLRELCREHGYDSSSLTQVIAAQILGTMAGDYFALLAYLPPTPEIDHALGDLRRQLRHVTKRAVTVGYGPRYLHGTGQMHKGGPNTGVFILLTVDPPQDIPVPGEAYTFGVLQAAQAAGDLEALHLYKRRAMHLHLGSDVQAGLAVLMKAIEHADARRQ